MKSIIVILLKYFLSLVLFEFFFVLLIVQNRYLLLVTFFALSLIFFYSLRSLSIRSDTPLLSPCYSRNSLSRLFFWSSGSGSTSDVQCAQILLHPGPWSRVLPGPALPSRHSHHAPRGRCIIRPSAMRSIQPLIHSCSFFIHSYIHSSIHPFI